MKATKTLGWLVMAAVLSFTGCSSDDNTAEEPMPPLGTQTGNIVDLSKLTDDYVAQDSDILTGTLSGFYKISIAPSATVTLSNATIPGRIAEDEKTPWAGITCLGDATIMLADGTENYVKGYSGDYPAIQAGPAGLFKYENRILTIRGTGKLTAEAVRDDEHGSSAAIGGGMNQKVGNIIIESGDITVQGKSGGAGIGSGYSSDGTTSCGDITISGGTITATGGDLAAGIGSGGSASCGDIIITGGEISSTGGDSAAGIGSGSDATCGNISITGGFFIAIGGRLAAGIGSGLHASCGNITIEETAIVTALGNGCPNNIGAGEGGTCGRVTIKDGTVNSLSSCSFTVNYYQTDGSLSLVKASKIIVNCYGNDYEFIGDGFGQLGPGATAMGSLPLGKGLTLTFTAETTAWNSNIPTGTYKATMTDVNITRDSLYFGTVNLVKQ